MRDLVLWQKLSELERDRIPHVLATVVKVIGSASAKEGSRALISADGKNLWGWVGGGCAEAFAISESLEALKEGMPRTILADLDDEVFGLGMPCGGKMEIFLEPRLPQEELSFSFSSSPKMMQLLSHLNFTAKFGTAKSPENISDMLLAISESLAKSRNLPFPHSNLKIPHPLSEFLILGHSRITEELAKLSLLIGWPTRIYGLNMQRENYPTQAQALTALPDYAGLEVKSDSAVLVASHHKGDAEYIQKSLEANASYIGMIASRKRAGIVYEHLTAKGISKEAIKKVRSPAGIELRCKNPSEIALSVISEIILGQKN